MKNKITFDKTLQHIIYPKWSPIIESIFNIKNQSVKRHLCNYCEWFSQSYNSETEYDNQLSLKLKDINIILDNFEKVDIVGKVYNQVTGIIEYKLSNGKYAPISGIIDFELDDNDLIKLLGIEYLKFYDLSKYRDITINKFI